MAIIQTLANIFVRLLAVGLKSKTRRRAFREAWFARIEKYLYFSGHKKTKAQLMATRKGPKIIIVTHELSITGAPLALLAATKILISHGLSVFLVSFKDGPLRVEFEKLNIPIVVGYFLYKFDRDAIIQISDGFDLVLASSVLAAPWVTCATQRPEQIIWWLHEAGCIRQLSEKFPQVYEKALLSAVHVYVVSEYARTFVEKYCSAGILYLGLEDSSSQLSPIDEAPPADRVRVAIIGTFCHRKNQELVLKALELMPDSSLDKLEILFIGRPEGTYYESLAMAVKSKWPVIFTGEVFKPEEKWRLFNSIDVFCVPSRDESCSLVVLEAFMLSKPVIISDRVGAKYLVEEGRNGFIFPNDQAGALKNILEWLLLNRSQLPALGRNGREKYLQEATMAQFEDRFMRVITHALSNTKKTAPLIKDS